MQSFTVNELISSLHLECDETILEELAKFIRNSLLSIDERKSNVSNDDEDDNSDDDGNGAVGGSSVVIKSLNLDKQVDTELESVVMVGQEHPIISFRDV